MTDMTAVETESPIVYPHQLSPETLTPEEEVGYVVESARIHYERGALGAMEMRRWIVDGLPEGYRIGDDGEIASDDPAAAPVPHLGDLAPLPQSEAVTGDRPRGYRHRSDGAVVNQDDEVVGRWSYIPEGSPEWPTPEEEVVYMVESARIHYERGSLGAVETRQWIAEMLPDGYRIGEDGEIASDDPAAPPLPNLGEWVPLPQSEAG